MGEDARLDLGAATIHRGSIMNETSNCVTAQPGRSVLWRTTGAVLLVAALLGAAGCGILFSKQRKPMKVEIFFTASDSLNFDGTRFQAVQVKAYLLKRTERFLAADARAFFNPEFDPGFLGEFAKDTLGSVTAIIAPGEDGRPLTIEVPFIRMREEKPKFAVIANFAQPPRGENRERMVYDIKKKTKQKVRVQLGTNWVEKGKKK